MAYTGRTPDMILDDQGFIDDLNTTNQLISTSFYTKSELNTANVLRADKYLASQNLANMIYTDGSLSKIQYNNATDVDYEVLNYTSGTLTSINHYINSVLKGTTTLSYTSGTLTSVIFTGV